MLDALVERGLKLAVLSNKPHPFHRAVASDTVPGALAVPHRPWAGRAVSAQARSPHQALHVGRAAWDDAGPYLLRG
jgi:hypothetical protein